MKKQLSLFLALYSAVGLSSCNGELFGSSIHEVDNGGVYSKQNIENEDAFFKDDLQDYYDPSDLEAGETKLTHFYFKTKKLNVYQNVKTKIRVISKPYQVYYDSISFELSDPSFGFVDDKGYLTATKIGSFTLTAHGPNGSSDFCEVNVSSGALEKIVVPESFSLTIGENEECDFLYSVFPKNSKSDIKYFLEDPSVATIVNNRVVASKAGYTRVVFYDDANDNNVQDKDEISTYSYLTVHDFINAEAINSISPTHSLNGKKTYQCLCGCGATKNVIIPATKHTFDEGVVTIEPTCTLAGERIKTCTDSTCDFHYEEVISPLGHTPSEEKHADRKHRAALGTHFEKTKYFYDCSVCHGFSDETFTREDDYSNYFTTNILPEYYGDDKEACERTIHTLKEVAETCEYYSGSHRPFDIRLIGNMSTFDYDWMMVTALSSGKTSPFIEHIDRMYRGFDFSYRYKFGYKQEEIDAFWEAFDKVDSEVETLIREGATDIEKALLILLYICNDISYDYVGFLPDTVKYKTGQCHDYANYFLYLAHRFDLPSYYVLGRMPDSYYDKDPRPANIDHAWVNVCIDGTWYMIDPTWCDGSNINLDYFCVQNDDYEHARRNNGNPTCVPIKNGTLNHQLIQLYKNNELAGIYYDMNKVIENINDSSADYKIILGIGTDGVANIGISTQYYKKTYITTKTSCNFKSLKIERCQINRADSIPTFKAPSSLLNLPNISFTNVDAVKQ